MFQNIFRSFVPICGIVSLHCTFVLGQQSIWENVLPLAKWNISTESPNTDLPAFKLYVEVKNVIEQLEMEAKSNGQEFLTPAEQVAVAAINEAFAAPQFNAAIADFQGIRVDYDKMFEDMNSNASSSFLETKRILGGKFDRVIERVNRLSIAEIGGLDPTGLSHTEFCRILGLTNFQLEKITGFLQEFRDEIATLEEDFANRFRQIRDTSRTQILQCMDADARQTFERIFGAPMDLIDSDGKSFFVDMIKAYTELPPSETVETIQSIAGKAPLENMEDRPQTPLANTIGANATHIKLDQLEFLLIRSNSVISELELTDGQIAELERRLTGPDVVVDLTTTDREARTVRLLEETPLDESAISSLMKAKQRSRFTQIELQVRTIKHIDSFGILDPVVPMNLGLTKSECKEIDKIGSTAKQEISQLISEKKRNGQARRAKLNEELLNVLSSGQVAKYRKFLGNAN